MRKMLNISFLVILGIILSEDINHELNYMEYRLYNSSRDQTAYIDASDFNSWVYFSFDSNDIIEIADPQNSLDWDLGFKRNHIKTNSGLSGIGNGGGYVNPESSWLDNWSTVFSVPDNTDWQADESMCCYYNPITHEFNVEIIKNPALSEWGVFDSNNLFEFTNYVMFIKDSEGNVAKFWPYDYYATNTGGGHIDIRYDFLGGSSGDALDCTGVLNGDALVDDCGDCQSSYCYDYVSYAVNFDLAYACDGTTEMLVAADSPTNLYWNSTCNQCQPDGDLNLDDLVNVSDVVVFVSHILNISDEFSLEDMICRVDLNGDGSGEVGDVVLIINIILGIDNN